MTPPIRALRRASGLTIVGITGIAAILALVSGCGGGSSSPPDVAATNPPPNNNLPPTGTGPVIPQPNNDRNSALLASGQSAPAWTVYHPTAAQPTKAWTVLVYMNGANDLGSGAGNFDIGNVLQMEQVGSNNNLNVVLQWEAEAFQYTGGNGATVKSNPAWTGTRRYYITKNTGDSDANIHSPVISQNDYVDTGDWQSLHDFVQWGAQAYPAQHYCLVVWDHGAGWRAQTLQITNRKIRVNGVMRAVRSRAASGTMASRAVPTHRGVAFNYSTGTFIDTDQLPEAINIGNLAAQKFDLLSFDCSLVQMVEVAEEVSNPGGAAPNGYIPPTYIEGSEESPPGTGLPYDSILANLANNPSQDPLSLAKSFCDETINRYGIASSSTQSVVSTARMAGLVNSLDTLGRALTNVQGTWGPEIALARSNAETFATGEGGGVGNWYRDYHDLLDFTNLLSTPFSTTTFVNDPGVLDACDAVKEAANGAIVYNRNGNQHPNSSGLSIWIPSPDDFTTAETQQSNFYVPNATDVGPTDQLYTNLSIASAAPNWLSFLQTGPSPYTPTNSPASRGSQ